ncbi:hypothetical protein HQ487_02915 [Candidatus Uhrbacteria bacterium]|nr:hypothetical protein [Candidatus Uhrbacteria bacterium]
MKQAIPKLWFFVFLAVGAIIIAILVTGPKTPQNPSQEEVLLEPTRATTYGQMLEKGGNAIYLENQTSGQSLVQVGFVILSAPGYVVIFDDNDGLPGKIIGSSDLLQSGGEHFFVSVDKGLEEDEVYYALIYHDNGDGRFREEDDAQATDFEDSVILMNFIATSEAQPEETAIMP